MKTNNWRTYQQELKDQETEHLEQVVCAIVMLLGALLFGLFINIIN